MDRNCYLQGKYRLILCAKRVAGMVGVCSALSRTQHNAMQKSKANVRTTTAATAAESLETT